MSILVVDDHWRWRQTFESLFSKDHYVFVANNGEQAIAEMTRRRSIKLVMLDIETPVTNGWEALIVIKDPGNWPDVPVFMMAEEEDPDYVAKAWRLGAQECLDKHMEPNLIHQLATKYLGTD